jgi:hypothetical protein
MTFRAYIQPALPNSLTVITKDAGAFQGVNIEITPGLIIVKYIFCRIYIAYPVLTTCEKKQPGD